MLGQEQKLALNSSSRPQECDCSRGPLTNTPVVYLELGTELLRGLVWASCVSLWGGRGKWSRTSKSIIAAGRFAELWGKGVRREISLGPKSVLGPLPTLQKSHEVL